MLRLRSCASSMMIVSYRVSFGRAGSGEQNTVGHDPQSCAGRAFVGETHDSRPRHRASRPSPRRYVRPPCVRRYGEAGCARSACRACHGQAPSRIFGSCVVLPEPVWPDTITTWERLTALAISSRAADTGSSAGYSYFMTNFNDTEALGARVFARSEPLAERIVQARGSANRNRDSSALRDRRHRPP